MGRKKKDRGGQQDKKRDAKKKFENKKGKTENGKTAPSKDQKTLSIVVPTINESVLKDLGRMKVLTPSSIGSRFNIRLSVAKRFLEDLSRKGLVTSVCSGRNIGVYKPVKTNA